MKYKIMTPGPTQVAENIRMARSLECTNPDLDEEFVEFYKETCDKISRLLDTQNETLILGGEGILGLEAACASMTEPGDEVLVLDNGIYGKGFADFVTMYGGVPTLYTVDERNTIDAAQLAMWLKDHHNFKYATVVHGDTPSGMLNDVAQICPLLKKYGILTVVDSVSAMFGEELHVDQAQIDILCGGSQKVVSAPPGLTFVTISREAKRAIENRKYPIASFYANLKVFFHYYEEKWFPYTMPISDIYGLRAAVDNIEADTNILERHRRIGEAARAAVQEAGLKLYLESGFSNTVTVFEVPAGTTDQAILETMREAFGIMLAGSFGPLAGKVIRIGHMGSNATVENMKETFVALDATMKKLGIAWKNSMADTFMETMYAEGGFCQVTAVGEARPDGERITKAVLTFSEGNVDPEGILVKDRTIVDRSVEGNVVTLVLSEDDPAAQVFPHPPRREGGPGGPGKGKGPDFLRRMPARKLLPVAVTVTIPGYEGEITSTKTVEPVIEDFVQGTYKNLTYNLFTPKNQEPGRQYPLVMFIPDLSANGDNPKMALAQGIGATVWAEPQEQAKHPCYVLAIQIPSGILLTNDDYIASPELEEIKELLDLVVAGNNVDPRRIYATGQSQGCMASCELNIRYPDLFAASMLVSGHWDSEKMIALSGKKFFFGLSSGGRKEYPCFNAVTEGMEDRGVDVRRIHLNFRDGWEVNNRKVADMLAGNPAVGYAIFDAETVFPDDGTEYHPGKHHSRGWELTYQLSPARDWLLSQHL